MHNNLKNSFGEARIMTMAFVWTGLALWIGLNAAFVARRAYVTSPRANAARVTYAYLRRV